MQEDMRNVAEVDQMEQLISGRKGDLAKVERMLRDIGSLAKDIGLEAHH